MMIKDGLLSIYWTPGSHTANVFGGPNGENVFTFSWDKDRPSAIDFVTSAVSYLEISMPQPESHMISIYFTPLQWETIIDALGNYSMLLDGPYLDDLGLIIDTIESELRAE